MLITMAGGLVGLGTASVPVAAQATPAAHAAQTRNLERARLIRSCVNDERERRGIAPLAYDPDLARAARMHARAMAREGFFDHDDLAGRDPADRVALFTDRYGTGVGENIASGHMTARAACLLWMNSAGHRENMLDAEYTVIGTGVAAGPAGLLWVQDFALEEQVPEEIEENPIEPVQPQEGDDPGWTWEGRS